LITKFEKKDTIKKKLTVIIIWLVATAMLIKTTKFILNTDFSLWLLILPLFVELIVVAGILLRCKIARWVTLLEIYICLLYPIISSLMTGTYDENFFSIILLNIFIVSILIYIFSNDEALELYYIESNPKEHFHFFIISTVSIVLYTYFVTLPFLDSIAKPQY